MFPSKKKTPQNLKTILGLPPTQMGAICAGKVPSGGGRSMVLGNRKIILGQQPLWQGDEGGTGMDGICPITYTGVCGRHLCLGGVAMSPVDGTFQAVPQHHSIMEYLLQSLGPRKREKPPGPPFPRAS